jgi:hypothetical protein
MSRRAASQGRGDNEYAFAFCPSSFVVLARKRGARGPYPSRRCFLGQSVGGERVTIASAYVSYMRGFLALDRSLYQMRERLSRGFLDNAVLVVRREELRLYWRNHQFPSSFPAKGTST